MLADTPSRSTTALRDAFPGLGQLAPGADRRRRRAQLDARALRASGSRRGRARASSDAARERLVFINAWNEWGEGCHLEPDRPARVGLSRSDATRTRRRAGGRSDAVRSRRSLLAAGAGDDDSPRAVLAFYLPQFHPIPENDEWWGRASPSGRTSLRPGRFSPATTSRSCPASSASTTFGSPRRARRRPRWRAAHGIEGFCYWHYWFAGRRLLERPFDEVLATGEPDFPFCLAWANESWSRAWLGDKKDVLIAQEYSLADDVEHARWLTRAFADERYVRVGGRPLFLVYRPRDLPSPKRTTDIIRQEATRAGLAEPFLLGITSFDHEDCRPIGFDGTVEFEPAFAVLPGITGAGLKQHDYATARRAMRARVTDFPTSPCVLVGWDNTARRGADAIVLTDSSPEHFERGLWEAVTSVAHQPLEERLVFINAWNEWAEGNHLEPDRRHGLKHLEVVDRVTRGEMPEPFVLDTPNGSSRPMTQSSVASVALPAEAKPDPPREPSPIIVMGAPRSGTTYLQRVLDLHPDVCLTHETRVFAWLHAAVRSLPANDQFVVTERERFVGHLRNTLPDVVRSFYRQLGPNTRYWGDKNPHYADPNNRGCLALTAELFEGARSSTSCVTVETSSRRCSAAATPTAIPGWTSKRRTRRGSRTSRSAEASASGSLMARTSRSATRTSCKTTWKERRELFAFLGIELDPAVEAFCSAQAHERTPLSNPTRRKVGDVTSSDWDTIFSTAEQVRSLELLGPYLVRLGYETEASVEQKLRVIQRTSAAAAVRDSGGAPRDDTSSATTTELRRLNWGCGATGEAGWINSDLKEGPGIDIGGDIRDGLPLDANSLDYIVSIHTLPMIPPNDLVPVLGEMLRMLKPGGVVRLGLPDLDKGIRAYLANDRSYFAVPDGDADSLGGKFVLHMLWYGYSVSMFTTEFTCELLRKAGFGRVEICGPARPQARTAASPSSTIVNRKASSSRRSRHLISCDDDRRRRSAGQQGRKRR